MTLSATPSIEKTATLKGVRADGSESPTAKTTLFFNKQNLKSVPASEVSKKSAPQPKALK